MSSLVDESVPVRCEPSAPAKGPVTSLHAALLQGKHTDLVVSRYHNKLFVAVTQVGTLGTICEVRRDKVQQQVGEKQSGGQAVYSLTVLLGQEREEVCLLARMLAEKLELSQPLLLCVGIKSLSPQLLTQIVNWVRGTLTLDL